MVNQLIVVFPPDHINISDQDPLNEFFFQKTFILSGILL